MVDYLGCLDKALVETLKNKSLTITTAESCTGGRTGGLSQMIRRYV